LLKEYHGRNRKENFLKKQKKTKIYNYMLPDGTYL